MALLPVGLHKAGLRGKRLFFPSCWDLISYLPFVSTSSWGHCWCDSGLLFFNRYLSLDLFQGVCASFDLFFGEVLINAIEPPASLSVGLLVTLSVSNLALFLTSLSWLHL